MAVFRMEKTRDYTAMFITTGGGFIELFHYLMLIFKETTRQLRGSL